MQAVIVRAAEVARRKLPPSPDELFLDYSRTGNRDRWQEVAAERRGRIATLTLAECVENRGRYLPPLEEAIGEICGEKTWVMPAHDRNLVNFKGQKVEMDLGACMLGWDLATARWLLADRLSPATRQLVADNLRGRILKPFREIVLGTEPRLFWMDATHNWNAVCLAGVIGTALASAEDREERALFAAAGEHYIKNFLRGFPADGYCSEGLGYWNYGFGHFLMLGESLRQATGGKLDPLGWPSAREPALFGLRAEILNGVYPTIADCSPGTKPDEASSRYIAVRFGLAGAEAAPLGAEHAPRSLYPLVLSVFLPPTVPRVAGVELPRDLAWRTWFADGGVLITRPGTAATAFAACLKGGHNAEHHNHNDVGSFSVVAGHTAVIADTGAEVYTARTFSGKRYDSDALNSFGHAVPVVAGQWQRTGVEARARVLQTEFAEASDSLALDIRSAYAVPSLRKLERRFVFRRGTTPSLVVEDSFAFDSAQAFETALLTWGDCTRVAPNELRIQDGKDAVMVQVSTDGSPWRLSEERLKADFRQRRKPLRIGIALEKPAAAGMVCLKITPGR